MVLNRIFQKLRGAGPAPMAEPAPAPVAASIPMKEAVPAPAYMIDWFWCDRYGVYLRGWVHCHHQEILQFDISIGEDRTRVTQFHERADLVQFYPILGERKNFGFEAYIPCRPGTAMTFHLVTAEGAISIPAEMPKAELPPPEMGPHYLDFMRRVNEDRLSVLEIGARIVGPMSIGNRQFYPKCVTLYRHGYPPGEWGGYRRRCA